MTSSVHSEFIELLHSDHQSFNKTTLQNITSTLACPVMVVRINTHGENHPDLVSDQSIITCVKDNDKRRAVKLERPRTSLAWGFTLQSYGIYNPASKCVENYTYVDYVDIKSPAYKAGVKRGDIIFAVNGQSTEDLSHDSLVDKIKTCKSSMRMVVVNANICQKVELHQRRQKLQALLRQRQSELKGLEKREAAILFNAKSRQKSIETHASLDRATRAASSSLLVKNGDKQPAFDRCKSTSDIQSNKTDKHITAERYDRTLSVPLNQVDMHAQLDRCSSTITISLTEEDMCSSNCASSSSSVNTEYETFGNFLSNRLQEASIISENNNTSTNESPVKEIYDVRPKTLTINQKMSKTQSDTHIDTCSLYDEKNVF